jgi:GNAT superfamily N-acetyltransferase
MLEKNGFRLVVGLLTFGVSPPENPPCSEGSDGLRWGFHAPEDLPALRKIASAIFSIDRFHSDPAIGKEKADEVYLRWVENSCAGFADCVLVARDEQPIGFTTLRIDRSSKPCLGVSVGVIDLVATSGGHRRKGVAKLLTLAALQWFRQAGCEWVEVGTQLANLRASRVYQAAGFKFVNSSLTFRRLM